MGVKLFKKSHDGGKDSGVTGYWIIEWKSVFSIVILRFSKGSREAFHEHAFNALTVWLKGSVTEKFNDGRESKKWRPFQWKITKRKDFHKIIADEVSWCISFRGRWHETWKEEKNGEVYELTHGRKRVGNGNK